MTAVVQALSFVVLETVTVPLGLPDRLRVAAVEMLPDGSRCEHCGEGVGVVIYGDADEHQRWMTTVIVDNGHRTWLLCEDCGVPLDPPATLATLAAIVEQQDGT